MESKDRKKGCCGQKRQGLTRREFLGNTAAVAGAAAAAGIISPGLLRAQSNALDAPTVTCVSATQTSIEVKVCAGASGAPAGFSLHWTPLPDDVACADYVWGSGDAHCNRSFSGVPQNLPNGGVAGSCDPNGKKWTLGPYECVIVDIADELEQCGLSEIRGPEGCVELDCDTTYVIRAFAHAVPGKGGKQRSPFSANVCCDTEPCDQEPNDGCTRTLGYWQTHGPDGCRTGNNTNAWPPDVLASGLTIGGTTYTAAQLCSALQRNPGGPTGGRAVTILAHQLIAAMLNIASGAAAPSCDVAAASALLTGLDINTSSVLQSTPLGNQMITASVCLDNYNNGNDTAPHCVD